MAGYIKYCTQCGKFFRTQNEWFGHIQAHQNKKENVQSDENQIQEENNGDYSSVPCDDGFSEDVRLQKTMKLRELKTVLRNYGVECSTMTKEEAKSKYDELVAKGVIKDE